MDCIKDICDTKEKLVSSFKSYIDAGIESACTSEVGEIAEVIKDLAEAEYYCTVTKAMLEASEDEVERFGYSRGGNGRSGSNGGHSQMRGYDPGYYMPDDIYGYSSSNMRYSGNARMGYRPYLDQEPYVMDYISEYGKGYDDYKTAKRHYTETHSPDDKEKMNESTAKHINNAIASIKEMWQDADTTLRKDIKADLTALVATM